MRTFGKRATVQIFWKCARSYSQLKAWFLYNRAYDSPQRPYNLYWISPSDIQSYNEEPDGPLSPCVRGGDWDLNTKPFEERVQYISLANHFLHDIPWRETDEFNRLKSKYNWTTQRTLRRLNEYDEMYNQFQDGEYKTQRELRSLEYRLSQPFDLYSICPLWNEIAVSIGRDGEFIWRENGQHRLTIAKLTEVEEVPVRIRFRHSIWQRKRDRIWTEEPEQLPENATHPDIADLLKLLSRK